MVEGEQLEVAVIFDARVVEVGEIAPVINDALRIGVREPDPGQRRKLEGRLSVGRSAQVHRAIVARRLRLIFRQKSENLRLIFNRENDWGDFS
jgi:hypothetical protein